MQNKNLQAIQEYVRERVIMAAQPCVGGIFMPVFHLLEAPITLTKILNALEEVYGNDYHKMIFQDHQLLFLCAHEDLKMPCQFYWKFLNGDGTDCTFEQQSEETQLAVAKLLGYEPTNTAESVENN